MKLLRYMHKDRVRVGALRGQEVVDLSDMIVGADDMLNLIADWDSLKERGGEARRECVHHFALGG
jgi:hypothetical protein